MKGIDINEIYQSKEPYDYFCNYINKITIKIMKEKLLKLIEKSNDCVML